MQGEQVAEKLAFPEGPVWYDDADEGGALYFVEIAAGAVSRFHPRHGVTRCALPGGGPNGATLGARNLLYVTQNGGMTRDNRQPGGIQRIAIGGESAEVKVVTHEVAGIKLERPNDLAFGPDDRLYFTDPRGLPDPARNNLPGRIFCWDFALNRGELIVELEAVFPNGIAFDREGTLLWTETFPRRVMALQDGKPELVAELPIRHFPDGFCLDEDGRMYVASTYGHCVTIIEDGKIIERLTCGDGMPTNCCFAGTDLYVTESRHGSLWRFPIGKRGLPLRRG